MRSQVKRQRPKAEDECRSEKLEARSWNAGSGGTRQGPKGKTADRSALRTIEPGKLRGDGTKSSRLRSGAGNGGKSRAEAWAESLPISRGENLPMSRAGNLPENPAKSEGENLPMSLGESLPESGVETWAENPLRSLGEALPENPVKSLGESLAESLPESLPMSWVESLPSAGVHSDVYCLTVCTVIA
jgi:hypothetical protein